MKNSSTYILISIVLFALCLTQDGYYYTHIGSSYSSTEHASSAWSLLLTGWLGVFGGIYAWLANPALLISWLFLIGDYFKTAAFIAGLAILFSASFLLVDTIPGGMEGRIYHAIVGYGYGYWLWIVSEIVIILGAQICSNKASQPSPENSAAER